MKHLILCYDLSFAKPLAVLAAKSPANLVIVINPNSGPRSPVRKAWQQLKADVSAAARKNSKRIGVEWFGYIDLVNWDTSGKHYKTRDMAAIKDDFIEYGCTFDIHNAWCDDCFVSEPGLMTSVQSLRSGTSTVLCNAGELIPASSWMATKAEFVCDFEANETGMENQIGPALSPTKNGIARIVHARNRDEAASLWTKGQALGLNSLAIVQDTTYQTPPTWWT
jgi:hypothetical protein